MNKEVLYNNVKLYDINNFIFHLNYIFDKFYFKIRKINGLKYYFN